MMTQQRQPEVRRRGKAEFGQQRLYLRAAQRLARAEMGLIRRQNVLLNSQIFHIFSPGSFIR